MQRGRGFRDPFSDFGDPFAGFGGFGGLGGFGGSRGPQSLISSFFGGRDPFDDPFFSRPFGGMFESSFFGPGGSPFADMHPAGFIEHQVPEPKRSRGPIIEELNSDHEEEELEKDKKGNSRKHGRSSSEPHVEDPDDEIEAAGRKNKQIEYMNYYRRPNDAQLQPQSRNFTFQSSSVTYGNANGAYYTSSKTRRTGSDGVTVEEDREADSTTREASHRISRGLHNKGHTVARKLNSDGRVNTLQTLHNLEEDELAGFENEWGRNARKHLPGWPGSFGGSTGAGSSGNNDQANRIGWALPSADARDGPGLSYTQQKPSGRMRTPSNAGEKSSHSRGKARN